MAGFFAQPPKPSNNTTQIAPRIAII
jgi:hypothetical protein